MKKIFTLLVLLCAIGTSNAQIQQFDVEKPKVMGKVGGSGSSPFYMSLEYFIEDSGSNRFILTYNDIEYKQITVLKSISFKATDEELNSLYNLLKARIEEKKDAETNLKIGEDMVLIVTKKTMGQGVIYLAVTGKGMFVLYTKTLNKLFGRD
jgi:hypothetical protein